MRARSERHGEAGSQHMSVCHKLLSAGFLRQCKHHQPEVRLGGGRCSARSARRACLSSDTAVLRRIASATSSSVVRPVHTGRCE